jgi:hypothetical protein
LRALQAQLSQGFPASEYFQERIFVSHEATPAERAFENAQATLTKAAKAFSKARKALLKERRAAMEEQIAGQGIERGMRITDGIRLWAYDGVEEDDLSLQDAAVRPRLLMVRRTGGVSKQPLTAPCDLDLGKLRPVRDDAEAQELIARRSAPI